MNKLVIYRSKDIEKTIELKDGKTCSFMNITFFMINNIYEISLGSGLYFSDDTKLKKLEECKYTIYDETGLEEICLFVFNESNDINVFNLYKKEKLLISSDDKANIQIKNQYLKSCKIEIINNYLSSNFDVFINGKPKRNTQLKVGDKVEILGFKLFIYEDFLYMNSFLFEIKLNRYNINPQSLRYNRKKPLLKEVFLPNEIDQLTLPELIEFKFDKKQNNWNIENIAPGLIMSFSMSFVSIINAKNSFDNGGSIFSILTIIIMPIAMFMTMVVWPIIRNYIEIQRDKHKYIKAFKKYSKYILGYKHELNNFLKNYLDKQNKFIININKLDELFYIPISNKHFMEITLGSKKLDYDFIFPKSDFEEVLNEYKEIKNIIETKEVPLFINLNEYRRITIVCAKYEKNERFNQLFSELIIKYSFNNLLIAIFSKDELTIELKKVPHLYHEGIRYTFDNPKDLSRLENINKKTILILLDNIKIDFNNKNVSIINLTSNRNELLNGSDCLIEYFHNYGLLETSNKIKFNYSNYDIDYKKLYNYISQYSNNISLANEFSFKDLRFVPKKDNGLISYFSYNEDSLFGLDISEEGLGPHGLIGGTTGSGKSELLVSFILGLACRYRCDYLNFIIIDYKGGGIKESLTYNQQLLPHIIATVDNLENENLERLLVYIRKECERRQQLYKFLSLKSNHSIMNINEYLKICTQYGFEKIAHLVIVADEFAELKDSDDNCLNELIKFSRIGRSLGLHLILATQKPSTSISEEIWSNTNFKIALKVQSEKDSTDIIKDKCAYYLDKAGEFYLCSPGQLKKYTSIYSKKDINNNDNYEISLLNNKTEILSTYKKDISKNKIYENQFIVRALNSLAKVKKEWDYKKPKNKTREELLKQYKHEGLIIGELDDYLNVNKDALIIDLSNNVLIHTSRENEKNNILNYLNNEYVIYIGQKELDELKDSFAYEDEDNINFIFDYLEKDKSRKYLLIDDLVTFLSYKEIYNEKLFKLLNISKTINLTIIALCSSNKLSLKITNAFKNKYLIESKDKNEIMDLFMKRTQYKGDSFFMKENVIPFVPCVIEELKQNNNPSIIKRIPRVIYREVTNNKFLIGYDLNHEKVYIDRNKEILVTGYNEKLFRNYIELNPVLYRDDLRISMNTNVLWLGEGIERQRKLFTSIIRSQNNEGILFNEMGYRKIRIINE